MSHAIICSFFCEKGHMCKVQKKQLIKFKIELRNLNEIPLKIDGKMMMRMLTKKIKNTSFWLINCNTSNLCLFFIHTKLPKY